MNKRVISNGQPDAADRPHWCTSGRVLILVSVVIDRSAYAADPRGGGERLPGLPVVSSQLLDVVRHSNRYTIRTECDRIFAGVTKPLRRSDFFSRPMHF